MKQLVLAILLLLFRVEQLVEALTVKSFSDGVPAQTRHRDLSILLILCLRIAISQRSISAVKRHFALGIRVLVDGQSAQAAPQLNVELQLDFILFIWLPQVK